MPRLPAASEADAAGLADLVRMRRAELGLTLRSAEAAGGPSHYTIVLLERGLPRPFFTSTLERLDEVLGWLPGTCAAVLAPPAGGPQ